jgi:hypothetical protein
MPVQGRVRLQLAGLYRSRESKRRLEQASPEANGIRRAEANP